MTDRDWNALLKLAAEWGEEYNFALERIGRTELERKQGMVRTQEGHDIKDVTSAEWLIAATRYANAVEGRNFTYGELDKVFRVCFLICRQRDRLAAEYQNLLMGGGDSDLANTVMDAIDSLQERLVAYEQDFHQADEDWVDAWNSLKDRLKPSNLEFADKLNDARKKLLRIGFSDIAEEISRLVKDITKLLRSANIQNPGVKERTETIRKALNDMSRDISAVESELGLTMERGQDSIADRWDALMSKVMRWQETHTSEYEWECPICGWHGMLNKRQPSEGSLINGMDLHWVWKCPNCQRLLAYDRQHPCYPDNPRRPGLVVMFWPRLWEVTKQGGEMDLARMAYVLESSVEYIVKTVLNVYGDELPERLQAEWDEWEARAKERIDE